MLQYGKKCNLNVNRILSKPQANIYWFLYQSFFVFRYRYIFFALFTDIRVRTVCAQWEFSRQKGMKIRFLAKAGLELETPQFP